jgi:hypothetical protein
MPLSAIIEFITKTNMQMQHEYLKNIASLPDNQIADALQKSNLTPQSQQKLFDFFYEYKIKDPAQIVFPGSKYIVEGLPPEHQKMFKFQDPKLPEVVTTRPIKGSLYYGPTDINVTPQALEHWTPNLGYAMSYQTGQKKPGLRGAPQPTDEEWKKIRDPKTVKQFREWADMLSKKGLSSQELQDVMILTLVQQIYDENPQARLHELVPEKLHQSTNWGNASDLIRKLKIKPPKAAIGLAMPLLYAMQDDVSGEQMAAASIGAAGMTLSDSEIQELVQERLDLELKSNRTTSETARLRKLNLVLRPYIDRAWNEWQQMIDKDPDLMWKMRDMIMEIEDRAKIRSTIPETLEAAPPRTPAEKKAFNDFVRDSGYIDKIMKNRGTKGLALLAGLGLLSDEETREEGTLLAAGGMMGGPPDGDDPKIKKGKVISFPFDRVSQGIRTTHEKQLEEESRKDAAKRLSKKYGQGYRKNLSVVPDPIEITDDMFITDKTPRWLEREAAEKAAKNMIKLQGGTIPKRIGKAALTGLDVGDILGDAAAREGLEMAGNIVVQDPAVLGNIPKGIGKQAADLVGIDYKPDYKELDKDILFRSDNPLSKSEIRNIEGILGAGRLPQVKAPEAMEEGEGFFEMPMLGGAERTGKIVTSGGGVGVEERITPARLLKYQDYLSSSYRLDPKTNEYVPRDSQEPISDFERIVLQNIERSFGPPDPTAVVEMGDPAEMIFEQLGVLEKGEE